MTKRIYKFSIFVFLFLSLLASSIFAAENLLSDPSFEEGVGWGTWTYSGSAIINRHDSSTALFGEYSASIKDCTGRVIITYGIPASPTNSYFLSGWIKTDFESQDLKAGFRLLWYRGDEFLGWHDFGSISGKTNWTFLSAEVSPRDIPQSADRVTVCCYVYDGTEGSKGTAYFDGINFSVGGRIQSPQAPDLISEHSNGTIDLYWTSQEENILGYLLYELDDPEKTPAYGDKTAETANQHYRFTDAEKRGKFFRVVAINENFIASSFSNYVKGDSIPPDDIAELTADDSNSGVVVLTWPAPGALDGDPPAKYAIYQLKAPLFSAENIVGVEYLLAGDDGFSSEAGSLCEYWYPTYAEQTYYYLVTAIDSVGNESGPSPIVSGRPQIDYTPPEAPLAPEVFYTTGPDQELLPYGLVLLRWQEPGEAADGDLPRYYLIYRGVETRDSLQIIGQMKAQGPGTVLTFLDVTATEGVTYYYLIRSVDKARKESQNKDFLVAKPNPPVKAEVILSPEDGAPLIDSGKGETIRIVWEEVVPVADEVAEYYLEFSRSIDFKGEVLTYPSHGGHSLEIPLSQLAGGSWFWRIRTDFTSGVASYSPNSRVVVIKSAVAEREKGLFSYADLAPKVFSRNGFTNIHLAVKKPAQIEINIFDTRGRLIKKLVAGEWVEEVVSFQWQGRDERNQRVPDGLYLVQIKAIAPPEPVSTVVKRVQIFN